jgi:hypothetical protein
VTGRSDADFERRVNEALQEGYQLQGPPSLAFDGDELIVAQPLIAPPRLG